MKIIVICLLSFLSLYAGMVLQEDKKAHFVISVPLGMIGETIVHTYDLSATEKIAYGTSLGLVAGLTKELYDEHTYSGFDIYDLTYDALGSFTGALTSYYLLNWVVEPSKEQIIITYNLKF